MCSGSLLPYSRIAAGVKQGDDLQRSVLHDEKQRVWETAHERAANIAEDNWKLPGICAHPLCQNVNSLSEAAAQSRCFAAVPFHRPNQFGSRGRSENNFEHLWKALFEFSS